MIMATGQLKQLNKRSRTEVNMKAEKSNQKSNPTTEPECACPIIRSENFTFYYGKKAGVENITLDINPCSVTAIIGPSGCGKSTFLRSINRMNDLIPNVRATGRLAVDGQDHLYVVWLGGPDGSNRLQRSSLNRGESWSNMEQVFGGFVGRGGWDALLSDPYGNIYWAGLLRYPRASTLAP